MTGDTEGSDLVVPPIDIEAAMKRFRDSFDEAREPERKPDPVGPFALYVCPRCRRVFGHPADKPAPERCGASIRGYSHSGVIGEYTIYCEGIPSPAILVPATPSGEVPSSVTSINNND